MRKTFALVALCLMAFGIFTSCKSDKDNSKENIPIKFAVVTQSESSSFTRSNGSKCDVTVNLSVKYPQSLDDKASTEALQKLFIQEVLEGNVNLPIEDAIKAYAFTEVSGNATDNPIQPQTANSASPLTQNTEEVSCSKVVISINVDVVYQQNNVLSMCKETVVQKDGVPSKTHEYYNFDVSSLKSIDLKMLRDDAIGEVCELLKKQLMSQNDVETSDELNDLGYFNIDNLSVTSNFYFGEKGITWSYLPQELAADANEEPAITLDYSTLKGFASDNSVLSRF